MRFMIVSLNNIQEIVDILHRLDLDIVNEDDKSPDFIITYGGDGTVLFSERKYPNIPKITIREENSIGSKCLYTKSELEDILLKIKNGKYKLREELKLETKFKERSYLSLNEVQVHNASPIKAIRFSVYVDDHIDNSHESDRKLILFDNIISDGVVIATPFGSTAYYSSVGGEKFDKGIGIAINNEYKTRHRSIIIDSDFDFDIHIKILRDDGLLLFDNDDKIIKVKGEDEILVKVSKDRAKFVIV